MHVCQPPEKADKNHGTTASASKPVDLDPKSVQSVNRHGKVSLPVWLRKRTVNREPNRSGTGRLRTGTNRTANYSYANRMGTNRTANYSYANRMEPNRFHILKKIILSASGGSENDFRELKIKLERGINCNEWIPAQHNLPKCCRNCK